MIFVAPIPFFFCIHLCCIKPICGNTVVVMYVCDTHVQYTYIYTHIYMYMYCICICIYIHSTILQDKWDIYAHPN